MTAPTKRRKQIVYDACRRFHHLPARTIARHLIAQHGELFENNLERARDSVRKALGLHGKQNRDRTTDKTLFREAVADIQMPETWRKIREPYHLPEGVWLVLSDVHVPFHEPTPLETAIKWGQAQNVDGVFLNGDIQDCEALSFWGSNHRDFNREMEMVIDFLDLLRNAFSGKPIVYKPGNHELRLPRRYADKLPELAASPLAAMETLIGFEEREIEFLDYHQIVQAGKLPIIHGHEVPAIIRTVNPARGLFLRTKTWAACSHCHTTSEHTTRDINGTVITTWSFGCLCDLSPDWNPFGNDWNWGAAIIHVIGKGDKASFEVENRRIMPSGKLR